MTLRLTWALWAAAGLLWGQTEGKRLAETDCTAAKLGTSIPVQSIGEPVGAVTVSAPSWKSAAPPLPAYCSIDGSIAPVDADGRAKPILFRVLLPSDWSERAAQLGGGGMNGMIPNLTASFGVTTGPPLLQRGFATYGSDSGHELRTADWTLSNEAIKNLGYMQLKKTHDAAMVLIQRAYGTKAGESRIGRNQLPHRCRWEGDPGRADPQHVRPASPVDGLGGEEDPASPATHGDSRRSESSPLQLSAVSEIHEWSAG